MIDRLSSLGQKRAVRVTYYLSLAAVLVLALMPQSGDQSFPHADKLMHLLMFAILAIGGRVTHQRVSASCLAGSLLCYGLVMELLQGVTTWRTASGGDLLADGIGILTGLGIMRLLMKPRGRL